VNYLSDTTVLTNHWRHVHSYGIVPTWQTFFCHNAVNVCNMHEHKDPSVHQNHSIYFYCEAVPDTHTACNYIKTSTKTGRAIPSIPLVYGELVNAAYRKGIFEISNHSATSSKYLANKLEQWLNNFSNNKRMFYCYRQRILFFIVVRPKMY
jgi:hypothetical protein